MFTSAPLANVIRKDLLEEVTSEQKPDTILGLSICRGPSQPQEAIYRAQFRNIAEQNSLTFAETARKSKSHICLKHIKYIDFYMIAPAATLHGAVLPVFHHLECS